MIVSKRVCLSHPLIFPLEFINHIYFTPIPLDRSLCTKADGANTLVNLVNDGLILNSHLSLPKGKLSSRWCLKYASTYASNNDQNIFWRYENAFLLINWFINNFFIYILIKRPVGNSEKIIFNNVTKAKVSIFFFFCGLCQLAPVVNLL